MKKIFGFLLVAGILIFTVIGCAYAQDTGDYEELHVASTTPMSGNFFNSIWGNNTSDVDVRLLLHGCDLVYWNDPEGIFTANEAVVRSLNVIENEGGDRTYSIVLYDDLRYSDGSPITAWDYAFSMLLTMSPEAEAAGANVKRADYLLGYEDYISGNVPYLAGVRVFSDTRLAITISRDYMPYFFELGLISCVPYPISEIAPGVRAADDGYGIYLTNIGDGPAVFSAELLRATLLDPQTGYMSHPTVTSGPYKLVSFEDGKASFEINEYFKGDPNRVVPSIKRLTYETIGNDGIIQALADGSVGLLNKVTAASAIGAGLKAVNENDARLDYTVYTRAGFGYISFNGENEALNETEVRQAIAYLIDRDAFTAEVVGEYGQRVDGYYGVGQWMYRIVAGDIPYPIKAGSESQTKKWEELSLDAIPSYEYDPEAAATLLADAGWNLNADGGAYESGVRYKQTDAGLVPLRLTLACPEGSSAIEPLNKAMDNLAAGGIEVAVSVIPFSELLPQFYNMTERNYDMFFLTSNFDVVFDPSVKFSMDGDLPVWGETGIADQELYDLAVEMRSTEPGDLLAYCKNWLNFQQRFAEVLPMLPLYSGEYYDFYPRELQDYNIAGNASWAQAVISARLGE